MKEDDYTLIDDFLHQRLNAEDAAAFEERLRQEPELAEATDFARLSHQFLDEQAEEDDFRQKLRAAAQAPNEQGRRGSLFRRPLVRVLAAAAAIALLLIWWGPWRADLYRQYAQHPPLALVQMSDNLPGKAEAEQAFNSGDYTTAANLLADLQTAEPNNMTIRLYHGIARLEIGEVKEARQLLRPIAEGQSALKEEALYYEALAAIKAGEPSMARAFLDQIQPGGSRYEAAQELLQKLGD